MQCNIDARGKAARLKMGIATVVIAVIVAIIALLNVVTGTWPWIVAAILGVMGGFAIFEARAGWCVVRAMGFKTPM